MAGHRLSLLKSLMTSLSGAISRGSPKNSRALSYSSTLLKPVNSNDNIIRSRFDDCKVLDETVPQHFFDIAGKWPDLVAVVAIRI